MRSQKFGIEIELTGLTREKAAEVAAEYFGTTASYDGTYYRVWVATDPQGRKWKFMSDSSIQIESKRQGQEAEAVELVSPICDYEDIPTVQELVRKLRGAGAIANSSCGLHVHVNAAPYDARKLRNLCNIMASKEDLIYRALEVNVAREHQYCQKADNRFLEELNRRKPHTLDAVKNIWYNGEDGSGQHYHSSRYHCLNLHATFSKGTIEFRLFNSTTHAGKIKSYIQLCLAISHQALSQRSASRMKTASSNEKYTFRTWLLRLGMIGDEFKTARLHLLEHLDGCIAWKDPEQAVRQRERLLAQREQERQQTQVFVPAPDDIEQQSPEEEIELADAESVWQDEQDYGLTMSM
jgi:hypothetical protein